MKEDEVDVLRAAIVFTSSGLDASMTRLVKDAGRYLIPIEGTAARAQYEAFIKAELRGDSVDVELQKAIVNADPAEAILKHYLSVRTKASFQGSGDLKRRVRNVLGIPSAKVSDAKLESLDKFFIARNSISHSMDYDDLDAVDSRRRIHRGPEEVVGFCNNAFDLAVDFIHAAGDLIKAHR
ncbi:hypothetical protein [Nocardioides sp. GXZ039]|uniref:hypothetical protein n=1 Tax=Nocardioides sp. GXZ039 TaxID=3136018 RepID=UPI0030F445DC